MRFASLFVVALCAGRLLAAADLVGTWSGTMEGKTPEGAPRSQPIHIVVKQSEPKLDGTAGPALDQQLPMDSAKVDGNTVSFRVEVGDKSYFYFNLTADGDQMKGTMRLDPASPEPKAQISVKKTGGREVAATRTAMP